ncbi:Rnf-Nqr domain containing protein [Parasphaerochaeta coccoides]|uniref:RnfA-Nqr electron transport subunit n=1 Tax=Parasphaerochaeta coccoides (strain ATCC BAA-1237 / DSM 17374 / SPN1) TaxID=760011 RepID=F4GJC2_PARC1|nr:Rnf-Nqr domain containing protein [Parasphaerochaeta coccoides]AEC01762.1 RnfA-Nqr electron transport subunit [Parasphaerochaeta coccoides DSM 17374]
MKFTTYEQDGQTSMPAVCLALGICTALEAAAAVNSAIVLGLLLLSIMMLSSLVTSFLRKVITSDAALLVPLIVIATFTSAASLLLQAFAPALHGTLGISLPLLTVNALILSRIHGFARGHGVIASMRDSLLSGLGFLGSLTVIALVREVLGKGTVTLFPIGDWNGVITLPFISSAPIKVAVSMAGGLMVLGMFMAFHSVVLANRAEKEKTA